MSTGMEPSTEFNTLQNEPRKKRVHSIALATFLMIVGLTLSKGTGFLRDAFLVQKFSQDYLRDAFYLGFTIPDLFYQLLVGGSIQAAITPTLARAFEKGENKRGWRSVSIFVTLMTVVMMIAVLLGVLFSDSLIHAMASLGSVASNAISDPGKQEETIRIAVQSSKALFPQVFFMMLAALCIGILNAHKKFASTAFGPTIYNVCVVLSIVILGANTPKSVVNASIGITAAAGMYFIFQFYMARRELRNFRFSLRLKDEGFRELLRLAIPTMISASIVQINMIVLSSFALNFTRGAVSSLRQASTIWQLPYGIFAVAVGNVMLPSLAAHFAAKDEKSARNLLAGSLRNALFLTIPSAGILFSMRLDVVNGILNWRGRLSEDSARMTASILMCYCIAVIMHTIVFIYNQAFYAIGKTKVPLYNGLITLVANALLCVVFINSNMGVMGLSLAYSLTSMMSAILLTCIYRRNKSLAPTGISRFLVRAALCLGVLLLVVYTLSVFPVHPQSKIAQLLWLAFRSIAGIGGYLLAARAMKMIELQSFIDKIRRTKRDRTA